MAKQFRRSDRIDWYPVQSAAQAEEKNQAELNAQHHRAIFKEKSRSLVGDHQSGNQSRKQVDYSPNLE